MHTNTGRQTRQKLREPLQRAQRLYFFYFLGLTIDFFFFFLSLWIYLWLAETSQQPISQTTWLKVTPNCNH